MKYATNVFLLVFLCVSGSHLFAFGKMPADEVRILFTGNTVEGNQKEGIKSGLGPPNMTENYIEEFVIYFAKNGIAKRRIGDKRKTGKWRITGSGELCLEWKHGKEKCAPVYKEGKSYYKSVTRNRMGRVLLEIVFVRITPGNKFDL